MTTFKPTQKVIHANAGFFAGLSGVKRIEVMGHSVSEVDRPYFLEVVRNIDIPRVRWKVSYFGDPTGVQKQVAAIGIPSAQSNLRSWQTSRQADRLPWRHH
ncbi:AbiH family protein [Mesorhizobium sp.]|uniref:AbiH family protein n=1 Tax=Mesorhizobium sp. TaxID=1871066 RepID=UPI0025F9DB94|nr:AbiH family protein [Mesorhizobium sp.]